MLPPALSQTLSPPPPRPIILAVSLFGYRFYLSLRLEGKTDRTLVNFTAVSHYSKSIRDNRIGSKWSHLAFEISLDYTKLIVGKIASFSHCSKIEESTLVNPSLRKPVMDLIRDKTSSIYISQLKSTGSTYIQIYQSFERPLNACLATILVVFLQTSVNKGQHVVFERHFVKLGQIRCTVLLQPSQNDHRRKAYSSGGKKGTWSEQLLLPTRIQQMQFMDEVLQIVCTLRLVLGIKQKLGQIGTKLSCLHSRLLMGLRLHQEDISLENN